MVIVVFLSKEVDVDERIHSEASLFTVNTVGLYCYRL